MLSTTGTYELHAEGILAFMVDAVFLVGNNDCVVFVNSQLTELTSISREEIIGKPYNYLFGQLAARADHSRETLKDLLAALDRIDCSPSLEFTISEPSPRHLQVALFPLAQHDAQPGWGGLIRDISSEYERSAQRTGALLALADEMRSSLVSIIGWVNTLLSDQRRWSREETHDFLRAINSNAEESIHLLENVRDVSRLELNELEMDCRPTDLKRLVQAVAHKLADEIQGLNLILDIPDDFPTVEVDVIRMSRGFQNLLYCILKLSFGCKVQFTVRQEDSKALIDISYQGISLSDKLHKDNLDEILQDHAHGSQLVRGLELRLYIARGILVSHDGSIWTEDSSDQGTVIHIALPLKRRPTTTQNAQPSNDRSSDVVSKSSRPNTKILVAGSDERILRHLRVQLELEGYRVITTNEGGTALELAAIEVPDVILLDLYLPDTDGLGICQRLREFTSAPIIMLAGDPDEKVVIRSLNMGADDYVTKPLRTKELIARIQANLRRSYLSEIPDKSNRKPVFKARDLEIDFIQRHVMVRGLPIDLTPIEYKLLHYLAINAGRILTHDQLVSKIWGPLFKQETQYLWVNISRLRAKIEDDPSNPQYVLTERGVGYYLTCPDDSPNGLV